MVTTVVMRMNVCEIFRNVWRISEKMSKIQKCLQAHTVLRTQIRDVLREWNLGSTVFILTSHKTEIAMSEPR